MKFSRRDQKDFLTFLQESALGVQFSRQFCFFSHKKMKKILMKKLHNKWMTLLELMLSMAIFSMIMVMIMTTVQSMTVTRIKNMNRIALTDELYFFSEQFFTAIKDGGTLDYEEYWNRERVWNTSATNSAHYEKSTGVGNYGNWADIAATPQNFGAWLYHCRSKDNATKMWNNGCLTADLNDSWKDQNWSPQRFGEYAEQFWDYNANHDDDNGDEDGNGSILGDEDDKNLWDWPDAITGPIQELYLTNIENGNPTRTFFRWKIAQDPNAPSGVTCSVSKDPNGYFTAGDWCLGNIQVLKLRGLDRGLDHKWVAGNPWAFDGKIDTWICETGWNCSIEVPGLSDWKLATWQDSEWKNMFPNSITVRKFRLDAFPKIDPWLAVAKADCQPTDTSCTSPFIHPYIRYSMELGFSYGARRAIKNEDPIISISTAVSLDDFK